MIGKSLVLLSFFVWLFLTGCSQKHTYVKSIDNNMTLFTQGDYELKQVAKELSKSLDLPINDSRFYKAEHMALGELTLIELPNSICIILTGKIFSTGNDKPIESTTYMIEDITNVLKKYPHLVIQVNGHSNKSTESNDKDLSDNRAISIAEILYKLEARHETYAKGCGDTKPLFTTFSGQKNASNARVEIYLYANKEKMIDRCK